MATLPPQVDDLAAWVGQEIDMPSLRAEALLSAASSRVLAYVGQTWEGNETPDDVFYVVVQVAARAWANPAAVESVTTDDTTMRWGSAGAAGVYLTEADKEALSGYMANTESRGIGTLGLSTGVPATNTIYVPTGPPPSGYPFPWYSAQDWL